MRPSLRSDLLGGGGSERAIALRTWRPSGLLTAGEKSTVSNPAQNLNLAPLLQQLQTASMQVREIPLFRFWIFSTPKGIHLLKAVLQLHPPSYKRDDIHVRLNTS